MKTQPERAEADDGQLAGGRASELARDQREAYAVLKEQNNLLELIASGRPLDWCLIEATRAISRLNPRSHACILLADAAQTSFPDSYFADLPPSFGAGLKNVPISDLAAGACSEAVFHGEPVTSPDVARDDRWSRPWRELCLAHGVRACHCEPVTGSDEQPLGSLMLCFDEPRAPTDWERRLAAFGAHVAAIAIERDRSETALRASEDRQAFLLKLSDALRPLADPVAVQAEAARVLGERLNAARAFYLTAEWDEASASYTHVVERDYYRHPDMASVVGRYPNLGVGDDFHAPLARGERMVVPDVGKLTGSGLRHVELYHALGVHSYIAVPLVKNGRYVAALGVNDSAPRVWTDDEVDLVEQTAERTWAAVERAQAEQALRESERRYRTLFESIDEGFCVIEVMFGADGGPIDYVFLATNPAFEKQTGIKDAVGRRMREIAPAHEGYWYDVYGRIARTGESQRFQSVAAALGREYDVFAFRIGPLEAQRVGVLFNDITRRKRTEQALRDSEARFHMIADNISQLAWTCDSLGHVTWYNQRWLDYTGLSFEEMEGWDWSKVLHPDHLERVTARVKHSAETGEPWDDAYPLRGADGRYRWFLSNAVPIRDERGVVLHWFGTNTDVTELREAEQALREADRRKDEFLAMLAHELRNPLAAISNAVQVAKRSDGDDHRRWSQTVIESQIKNLSRMIDDLLDVSRITQGKIQLRKKLLSFAPIISSAVESVRPLLEERNHRLLLDLETESLSVEGDPTRLEQIFVNLLNNAAKYTEMNGCITLSVRKEGAQAVVAVEDTGVGMSPDLLGRAFELFAQGDRTIARSEGGLGIGLTLVQSLVEMHLGSIEAHSEGPGEGSRFTVRLPLVEERSTQTEHEDGSSTGAARTGRRVLVVDDNEDTARGAAQLLKLLGHDVRTAHDGPSAIEEARNHRPEVVLLDIGLPGMDGYRVAQALRDQGFEQTVIIAVTGYGDESAQARSRESGFNHHLVKPVDYELLAALVEGAR